MTPSIFISYSHQEAPFVESLRRELEDRKMNVWLDYASLVPGKPWHEDIVAGIENAEVILVVVSKAAMASENVDEEWTLARRLNKRIVLAVFERVHVPEEAGLCEWVDFRGSFKRGIASLLKQFDSPITRRPPRGFKAPFIVWASVTVSVVVSVVTLPAIWTLYAPYHLVALPYKVLKRDFNFLHVNLALLALPFALFMTQMLLFQFYAEATSPDDILAFRGPQCAQQVGCERYLGGAEWAWVVAVVFGLVLFLLLRSRGMQRWGRPVASRPQTAAFPRSIVERPRSVDFAIDVALEDQRYADALAAGLTGHGHRHVPEARNAEATFVLVSAYKRTTVAKSEEVVLYPVIIQGVDGIDPKLQRIQWIDFRRGLRNLDGLANLLPEPAKLLKVFGNVPSGDQIALPRIVHVLVSYLVICGTVTVGGGILLMYHLRSSPHTIGTLLVAVQLGLTIGTTLYLVRSLVGRTRGVASMRRVVLGVSALVFLAFLQVVVYIQLEGSSGPVAFVFGIYSYVFGLVVIVPFLMWYWRDLRRWLPRKSGR